MIRKGLSPYTEEQAAGVSLYDKNFLEPERILYTNAMFPIIYPDRAAKIKGKWYERCVEIVMILLNFRRGMIKYGIYFLEPFESLDEG
jgi:hypothetical protein